MQLRRPDRQTSDVVPDSTSGELGTVVAAAIAIAKLDERVGVGVGLGQSLRSVLLRLSLREPVDDASADASP